MPRIFALFASMFVVASSASAEPPASSNDRQLAARILADERLPDVLDRAERIVKSGFNAGDGYGEVWIRDFATFIELSCEVGDPAEVKRNLLMFFRFQGNDGNIIDGFIPAAKANVNYQGCSPILRVV